MGLHQIKKLCKATEANTRVKKQLRKWEKIFASYPGEKGLIFRISRIYIEVKKLNTKRTNNPINKWANI
jgi:hypothetical protein